MKWLLAWLTLNALVFVWRSLVVLPKLKLRRRFGVLRRNEICPSPTAEALVSIDIIFRYYL